jgi:hypothetical protein
MKSIAFLTMTFLPATFISVCHPHFLVTSQLLLTAQAGSLQHHVLPIRR